MKKLLSTTALVAALSFPTLTGAQTQGTAPADQPAQQQRHGEVGGFLAERGQSDLLASELMGHDVHARRTRSETRRSDGQDSRNADGTRNMVAMNRTELDDMEHIGQINDIVLSSDGQIRAVVIGVGGFLGIGEQDVAVMMDHVTFASDNDDRSQMYIVVNTGMDSLQNSPAYDRSAMRGDHAQGRTGQADQGQAGQAGQAGQGQAARTDRAEGQADTRADQTARADGTQGNAQARDQRAPLTAPRMQRDGYDQVEMRNVSTEMLMGESVYDINDNDVGSVTDMIIGDDGAITNIIIDFGGFLGIGSSQASIGYDELTILTTQGYADVRIYVDATREQIQELPRYLAGN